MTDNATGNLPPNDVPEPFAELAADLRKAAEAVAALVGKDLPAPWSAGVYLTGSYSEKDAEAQIPVIDALGEAFGTTAANELSGRGPYRSAKRMFSAPLGRLRITASTVIPAPPTRRAKMADLVEENTRLRARLQLSDGTAGETR
jgi:hypothetical protein